MIVPGFEVSAKLRHSEDKGLTNTGSGEIAGCTNLKNQSVSYDPVQTHLYTNLCDGCLRTYVPDKSWAFYQQLPVRFVLHTDEGFLDAGEHQMRAVLFMAVEGCDKPISSVSHELFGMGDHVGKCVSACV